MGRYKLKKQKDWKAKFRKPASAQPHHDPLSVDLVSPLEMYRDEPLDVHTEPERDNLNLRERNLFLLDAATNIFDLSKQNWNTIRQTISGEQIREI